MNAAPGTEFGLWIVTSEPFRGDDGRTSVQVQCAGCGGTFVRGLAACTINGRLRAGWSERDAVTRSRAVSRDATGRFA